MNQSLKKRMRRSEFIPLLASLVGGGVLGYSASAPAWWQRNHGGDVLVWAAGHPGYVTIPFLNQSSMPMSGATALNLEVQNWYSSTKITVTLCSAALSTGSQSCSAPIVGSGFGHKTFAHGANKWIVNSDGDFGYFFVKTEDTANRTGAVAEVLGYYVAD